jgi:hypothetical protein
LLLGFEVFAVVEKWRLQRNLVFAVGFVATAQRPVTEQADNSRVNPNFTG